jgi:hypothetical protein
MKKVSVFEVRCVSLGHYGAQLISLANYKQWNVMDYVKEFRSPLTIQLDSKGWTQFCTSIFPEL